MFFTSISRALSRIIQLDSASTIRASSMNYRTPVEILEGLCISRFQMGKQMDCYGKSFFTAFLGNAKGKVNYLANILINAKVAKVYVEIDNKFSLDFLNFIAKYDINKKISSKFVADFDCVKIFDENLTEPRQNYSVNVTDNCEIFRNRLYDTLLVDLGKKEKLTAALISDGLKEVNYPSFNRALIKRNILSHVIPEDFKNRFFITSLNLDKCGALDLHKGCFLGQEVCRRILNSSRIPYRMFSVKIIGGMESKFLEFINSGKIFVMNKEDDLYQLIAPENEITSENNNSFSLIKNYKNL